MQGQIQRRKGCQGTTKRMTYNNNERERKKEREREKERKRRMTEKPVTISRSPGRRLSRTAMCNARLIVRYADQTPLKVEM